MLMFIGILAAAAVSVLEIFTLCPKKTLGRCLSSLFKYVVCGSTISAFIWKYVFQYEHFLFAQGLSDYFLFFLLTLAVSSVIYLSRRFLSRKYEDKPLKKGMPIAAVILFCLGLMCIFLTNWSQKEYGTPPADQILITYFSPTTGSSMVDYYSVAEGPILFSLVLTSIFGLFIFSPSSFLSFTKPKAKRVISLLLALVLLLSGLGYGIYRLKLLSLYNAYFSRSTMIDSHFVDPRDANLQFPKKKRNLIHIYLESMENSYMSKDLGGFMDENLIPELTDLAREGYSFSHLDGQFGGPEPAVGTTWSVASMVNMSTGLPMKAPTENNAYGSPGNFLPGAWTLGDILAQEGYEQTVMFGADADFGGLTYFFGSHGGAKMMDYKYAKENGLIPKDYRVWWGYEDDKLFDFAKEELTRLSETGKPFSFTMETADTHRPSGYLSSNAPTPYDHQYANVVAYSSSEVNKFVRWIQEQPFYENTTVVIIGDHLSMESGFFEFYAFDSDYRRSQYNVILNPAPDTASDAHDILFNREYANFDMFPTILTSMGVTYDGHRLGIGTDLFSGEKTLFEEYGFAKANRELEKMSILYNRDILAKSPSR